MPSLVSLVDDLSKKSSTRKRRRDDIVRGSDGSVRVDNDNGDNVGEIRGGIVKIANTPTDKGRGGNEADSTGGRNCKAKKENPVKDPSAPRGVPGAFTFYQNDMRPKLRMEMPSLMSQEKASILGKRCQTMTSDERKSYSDLREEDNRRHHKETKTFNSSLRQAAQVFNDETNAGVNHHFIQPESVDVSILTSPSGVSEKTSPLSHFPISSIHSPANGASENGSATGKESILKLEGKKDNKADEDDKDRSMFEGLSKCIMAAKGEGRILTKNAIHTTRPKHQPSTLTVTGKTSASEKIVAQLESMKNPEVKLQHFFVEKFTGNNFKAVEEEDLSISNSSSNDSIWNVGLPAKIRECEGEKHNATAFVDMIVNCNFCADASNQKKRQYTDHQKGNTSRKEEGDDKKHEAEACVKNHEAYARTIMGSESDSYVDCDETQATAKTANKKDFEPSDLVSSLLFDRRYDMKSPGVEIFRPLVVASTATSIFRRGNNNNGDFNNCDSKQWAQRQERNILVPSGEMSNVAADADADDDKEEEEDRLIDKSASLVSGVSSGGLKNAVSISSTKLNLVPMTKPECQAALQEKMIMYSEPDYLVPGTVEYDTARETITLEAMRPLGMNKSALNSEYKTSVPLGRNDTTKIKWTAISREICEISLISKRFDPSAAFIKMTKAAEQHAVCLNGRELNVPVGTKVPLKDSDILSLYGPTGFAYQVKLSVLRKRVEISRGDE
jgi:hypothetical protein